MEQIREKEEKIQFHSSVRNLVEFLFRSGDISDGGTTFRTPEVMQKGSNIHRYLQKKMGKNYHEEVFLSNVFTFSEYDFGLEGRADGISYYEDDNGVFQQVCIDEIKGTYQKIASITCAKEVHMAQAKCYGYLFALSNPCDKMKIQVRYCHLETLEIKEFQEEISFEQLQAWFLDVLKVYEKWLDFRYYSRKKRNQSIMGLDFPYPYRRGQHKLMQDVYKSIYQGKILFLQAPTGTGKTLATIYPAVCAMGRNQGEKICYLTAKTATGAVAQESFALLKEKGYFGKTVVLTAKDKICPMQKGSCQPQDCAYAKGHYDRINQTLFDMLKEEDMMDREVILKWANIGMVCPFELSLEATIWVDHMICDYNYVFDPNVALKRLFAEGKQSPYIYLIDEAHNLVDRGREMFSESLEKESFLEIKSLFKHYSKRLEQALDKCNRFMLQWKKDTNSVLVLEDMDRFLFALFRLADLMEEVLENEDLQEGREAFLNFYFKVRNFLRLSEGLDSNYLLYCDFDKRKHFWIHLFCMNPARCLQNRLDTAVASVLFSATLLPMKYHRDLLCDQEEVYGIYAESSFSKEQCLLVIGTDVSAKYNRRTPEEFMRFAQYIMQVTGVKKGNYMVFCPSYAVMEKIMEAFQIISFQGVEIIAQNNKMSEEAKENFLLTFQKTRDNSLVAFCVMGGIFSEGIDLVGEKLIGVFVIGTGIPQIGLQKELIKTHFQNQGKDGFAYAYRYPGMNKVIQSAGRVIRTNTDKGMIFLLDDRFLLPEYQQIFPKEWTEVKKTTVNEVGELTKKFWEK